MQKKYCSLAPYILGQINFSSVSLLAVLQHRLITQNQMAAG